MALLLVCTPLLLWAAWSDLRRMIIPNACVLALGGAWLLLGWLPGAPGSWWGGVLLAGFVLVIGFLGNLAGLFGAGDAKMAAAIAPLFQGIGPDAVLMVIAIATLGGVGLHRFMRAVPCLRGICPDWDSWRSPKFPFGLVLAALALACLIRTAVMPAGLS